MNKIEKKLLIKILSNYNKEQQYDAENKEAEIINMLITIGYLRKEAFHKWTNANMIWRISQINEEYPITEKGKNALEKSAYIRFRDSLPLKILRDSLTVSAFVISLILALKQI